MARMMKTVAVIVVVALGAIACGGSTDEGDAAAAELTTTTATPATTEAPTSTTTVEPTTTPAPTTTATPTTTLPLPTDDDVSLGELWEMTNRLLSGAAFGGSSGNPAADQVAYYTGVQEMAEMVPSTDLTAPVIERYLAISDAWITTMSPFADRLEDPDPAVADAAFAEFSVAAAGLLVESTAVDQQLLEITAAHLRERDELESTYLAELLEIVATLQPLIASILGGGLADGGSQQQAEFEANRALLALVDEVRRIESIDAPAPVAAHHGDEVEYWSGLRDVIDEIFAAAVRGEEPAQESLIELARVNQTGILTNLNRTELLRDVLLRVPI